MRLLFVKERLSWPRSSGHDVHTYYTMQALARLGHTVGLVTLHRLDPEAIVQCDVTFVKCLREDGITDVDDSKLKLSKLQEKYRSYWGIDKKHIARVGEIATAFQADAVIVVGLNVLPYLGAVVNAIRIWYAADEWAWHHLSQIRPFNMSTWAELKQAAIKGLYERAYAPLLDRVWMVSAADQRAIRWVASIKNVDVLPNGVDTGFYNLHLVKEDQLSCVFWGRLDFGPNIQALLWFCSKVWPRIRLRIPGARFTIYGFQPTAIIEQLAMNEMGIELIANLSDIRQEIARHQIVVLPFVSGGGIKNKLLEASAMGKAIVCTPRTTKGLSAGKSVVTASTPREWEDALSSLWSDADRRRDLGKAARAWVIKDHTWESVARNAINGIKASLQQKGIAT